MKCALPKAGYWYDFFTGDTKKKEEFEFEVSNIFANSTPVFIKAGSIIPYRVNS